MVFVRLRRAALLLVPVLVLVAACSSGSGGSSPSGSSGGTPTVKGGFGATPTITLPSGSAPTTLQTTVLVKGTGPVVAKGELLVADYHGELWDGGKVFDSSFTRGAPASFLIGTGAVIPGWDKALVGQTVGSRILLVIPPADGYGSAGNSQGGIKGTDTLVFVVDLRATFAPDASATGVPAPPLGPTLPKVGTAPGAPSVTIPNVPPPTTLVSDYVVVAPGTAVAKGDLLVVQYVGKLWRTGKTFDASWLRGAPVGFTIGVGQVIPGWDTGLVGKKVGSRVLLVLPPKDGYGSAGNTQAGIKGTDTLVFVVDLLGAFHKAG